MTAAALKQRREALDRGNTVRVQGAAWKRQIRDLPRAEGATMLANALKYEDFSEAIGAVRINQALVCVRSISERKATGCLIAAEVFNGSKRIRDLTDRQRMAIAVYVRVKWA